MVFDRDLLALCEDDWHARCRQSPDYMQRHEQWCDAAFAFETTHGLSYGPIPLDLRACWNVLLHTSYPEHRCAYHGCPYLPTPEPRPIPVVPPVVLDTLPAIQHVLSSPAVSTPSQSRFF